MEVRNELVALVAVFLVLFFTVLLLALFPAFFTARPFELYRDQRVILLTGAASRMGIGRSIALRLVQRASALRVQLILVLVDLDLQGLEDLAEEIENATIPGGVKMQTLLYCCDLSKPNQIEKIAVRIRKDIGPRKVSVVINNAGVVKGKPFVDTTTEDYLHTLLVNTVAPFKLLQEFLPAMMEDESEECMYVTVSSLMGLMGSARLVDYCSSKFAVTGLHEALRVDLQRESKNHIRSLIVYPYAVNTGMFSGIFQSRHLWLTRFLFPLLHPQDVGNRIVLGMEQGEHSIIYPRLFTMVPQILHVLPVPLMDYIGALTGARTGMDTFQPNMTAQAVATESSAK